MNGTQIKMHTCTQADRQTYLQCNKSEVELFWQLKVTHPSIPSFSLSLLIPRTTDSHPQPRPTRLHGPLLIPPSPFPFTYPSFPSSKLLSHNLNLARPTRLAPTHSSLSLSLHLLRTTDSRPPLCPTVLGRPYISLGEWRALV